MTARAWRYRRDGAWRPYRRALLLGLDGRFDDCLVGAREGHGQVFDRRIRTALLRRDRRARRRGQPVPRPAPRIPTAWDLPDANPFEDMRQVAAEHGAPSPMRAVLARSQLDRLLPTLNRAGFLDA